MLLEIFDDGIEPLLRAGRKRRGAAEPELCCKGSRNQFDLRSAQWQAVIRSRTGDAGRRLDHIQPIHFHFREYFIGKGVGFGPLAQQAAARKFSRVPDVPRAAAQEIGIERKDDVSLLRPVNRVDVTAECQLRALARAIADGGFPLMPLGFRKKRQERLNLRGKCRRIDNPSQDAKTSAV